MLSCASPFPWCRNCSTRAERREHSKRLAASDSLLIPQRLYTFSAEQLEWIDQGPHSCASCRTQNVSHFFNFWNWELHMHSAYICLTTSLGRKGSCVQLAYLQSIRCTVNICLQGRRMIFVYMITFETIKTHKNVSIIAWNSLIVITGTWGNYI